MDFRLKKNVFLINPCAASSLYARFKINEKALKVIHFFVVDACLLK